MAMMPQHGDDATANLVCRSFFGAVACGIERDHFVDALFVLTSVRCSIVIDRSAQAQCETSLQITSRFLHDWDVDIVDRLELAQLLKFQPNSTEFLWAAKSRTQGMWL